MGPNAGSKPAYNEFAIMKTFLTGQVPQTVAVTVSVTWQWRKVLCASIELKLRVFPLWFLYANTLTGIVAVPLVLQDLRGFESRSQVR